HARSMSQGVRIVNFILRQSLSKGVEARRNIGIEVAHDFPHRGKDSRRLSIHAQDDAETPGRLGSLPVVDVDGRAWRCFEAVGAGVTYNSDDGEQAQVAVHVAELDRLAQRV